MTAGKWDAWWSVLLIKAAEIDREVVGHVSCTKKEFLPGAQPNGANSWFRVKELEGILGRISSLCSAAQCKCYIDSISRSFLGLQSPTTWIRGETKGIWACRTCRTMALLPEMESLLPSLSSLPKVLIVSSMSRSLHTWFLHLGPSLPLTPHHLGLVYSYLTLKIIPSVNKKSLSWLGKN
jgi:hypothetical protein